MTASEYSMMLLSPHNNIPAVSASIISRGSISHDSIESSCSSSSSESEDSCPDTSKGLPSSSPSTSNNNNRNKSVSLLPLSSSRCLDYGKCMESCAAYGRICPLAKVSAGHAAEMKMKSIIEHSALFDGHKPTFTHTIPTEDLILGDKLGEGGFCNVYACAMKDRPLDESCAVKFLRRQITVQKKHFEHGAADLATEAFFLTRLNHPNIVGLRAVTAGSVESNIMSESETGFFLIIDRLVETLEQRIHRWKKQMDDMPHSLFYRMSKEYKDNQKSLLKDRLQVAVDIVNVMSYLHSLNVTYRDLKPDNVGFDREGTLKLFDLGLCKEEKSTIATQDGKFRMTGHTGSRRYMAPEVAMNQPYDKSIDVYSFGVLLWELCSLEKPFSGYCSKKHMTHVIVGGERPKMDHSHTSHWPTALQTMIKHCWSSQSEERPSFTAIKETLEDVIKELSIVQPQRTRAQTVGSHEEGKKIASPLSPTKKIKPLSSFSGLRARSLGLKRSQS